MNTVLHNILLILRSDRERGLRRRPSPTASIWITTLRCRVLASATSRKPRGAHKRKSKYRDVVGMAQSPPTPRLPAGWRHDVAVRQNLLSLPPGHLVGRRRTVSLSTCVRSSAATVTRSSPSD